MSTLCIVVVAVATVANIESSPIWDPSCLLNQLIYIINRQYLCGKCLKPVTIQDFHEGERRQVM